MPGLGEGIPVLGGAMPDLGGDAWFGGGCHFMGGIPGFFGGDAQFGGGCPFLGGGCHFGVGGDAGFAAFGVFFGGGSRCQPLAAARGPIPRDRHPPMSVSPPPLPWQPPLPPRWKKGGGEPSRGEGRGIPSLLCPSPLRSRFAEGGGDTGTPPLPYNGGFPQIPREKEDPPLNGGVPPNPIKRRGPRECFMVPSMPPDPMGGIWGGPGSPIGEGTSGMGTG